MKTAQDIFVKCASERREPVSTFSTASRRRSFANCLRQAHEGQPPKSLNRTFGRPMLTRTCLTDLSLSAPFRHSHGELGRWTMSVCNKKHTAGGHYVEHGGSLR